MVADVEAFVDAVAVESVVGNCNRACGLTLVEEFVAEPLVAAAVRYAVARSAVHPVAHPVVSVEIAAGPFVAAPAVPVVVVSVQSALVALLPRWRFAFVSGVRARVVAWGRARSQLIPGHRCY